MVRTGVLLGVIILMILPHLQASENDVIVVAAEGKTVEAAVSQRAARCSYFLFFDGDGNLKSAEENPFKDNRGSAGVSAADYLAERNVSVLVAGMFGNKMQGALEGHEITMVEFSGSVADALKHVLK
jgi:predicted Fe-Mo cluster-binding NifX family protein